MPGNDFECVTLFGDLDSEQRRLLSGLFQASQEPADTVLFEQGDPAEYLYIVIDGEVHIRFKPEDGPELLVARVRTEGVVGWSAALGSPAYTSSAVCSTDCRFVLLRGDDLRDLYARDPETGKLVLERLAAVIAERLRNTHHHVLTLLEQGLSISVNRPIAAG